MPCPTNPEIPQYLAPKSERRDTTYQKTKKQKKGEIRSYNTSACHSPKVPQWSKIRSTRHCSKDWAVFPELTYYASKVASHPSRNIHRITNSQSSVENCTYQTHAAPDKKASSSATPRQRNSGQEGRRAIKKKNPPTQQDQQNN